MSDFEDITREEFGNQLELVTGALNFMIGMYSANITYKDIDNISSESINNKINDTKEKIIENYPGIKL